MLIFVFNKAIKLVYFTYSSFDRWIVAWTVGSFILNSTNLPCGHVVQVVGAFKYSPGTQFDAVVVFRILYMMKSLFK